MKRSGWSISALMAFALATGGVLAAAPAGALSVGVGVGVGIGVGGHSAQQCSHLRGSASYSPGLSDTETNNTLTVNGGLARCAGSRTGGSGTFTSTISIPAATCAKVIAGQQLTALAATTWRSGRVSNYSLRIKTGTRHSEVVASFSGKVTSGLFSGRKVSGAVKIKVVGSANCKTVPVTQLTFKEVRSFVIS